MVRLRRGGIGISNSRLVGLRRLRRGANVSIMFDTV